MVEEFKYLGSITRNSGSCTGDVMERVASSSELYYWEDEEICLPE